MRWTASNSLFRSESDTQQLVGIGLNDIMAIAMPDAVLVAHRARAQDVKRVVSLLKAEGVDQAEVFPKDYRPWGWFESLAMVEGQSVYVPLGAWHRLENPGELPMVLIEVQIGTYLGEDDIVRYEDLYARQ